MAKTKNDSGKGAGPGFYALLAVVAVGGLVALYLATGSEDEAMAPLGLEETGVEADPDAAVVLGAEDAPVTLTEFADYTCGFCARFAGLNARFLKRDYVDEGLVRWRFYDFPLNTQSNAIPAALAARCAAPQDRFWEMHGLIFANQSGWAGESSPRGEFEDYAREVGLELDEFRECYSERHFIPEILASRNYGRQMGVDATPTVLIDGERVEDWQSYDLLESRIQEALAAAEEESGDTAAESGTPAEESSSRSAAGI